MIRQKKKIKILFTLSELMYGSKTRQLIDIISGLDKDIFEPEIAVSTLGDEATADIMALGVPLHKIRFYPPHQRNLNAWLDFFVSSVHLRRCYDIVHSLHYSSFFYEALILKSLTKSKYIYSKSNPEWDNHRLCWTIKSRLADKIIAGSSSLSSLLSAKGFSSKVETIFYGIDTNYYLPHTMSEKAEARKKLNIDKGAFIFGCAAQFVRWKNHILLIRAFSKLLKKGRNCFLILCGQNYDDSYFHEVESLIHQESIQDRVIYLGVMADMREFYELIDCFVLPSINEAFGLVFAEAMSSSIPVIGTDLGGPRDLIVHNENGFLIGINNEQQLLEYMDIYANDLDTARLHGAEGRRRAVKHFDKKDMVSKHARLYYSLIDQREKYAYKD